MITIVPNTTSFRKVPAQSGVYQMDWTVMQSSHNGNMEISLSGYGSRFFAFGSDSGNYYASGDAKKYFEANIPNIERTYSFVLSNTKYDVFDEDGNPIVLAGDKSTGYCDRIYTQATSGAAGEFELTLKGKTPQFTATGTLTFPINGPHQTSFDVYNSGDVPFSILSGAMSTVDYISGFSDLPKLIQPGSTAHCALSGQLATLSEQGAMVTLYTDFTESNINTTILPTTYSGSGYLFTAPDAPVVYFDGIANMAYQIFNTGTTTLKFTPIITLESRDIAITTGSVFYANDRITWSGGEFYIIQTGSGTTFNYLVNTVSGSGDINTISTGTYYKYASDDSFSITRTEITSFPNENTMIVVEYQGIVSGLNIARLQLSGIGVNTLISGETY